MTGTVLVTGGAGYIGSHVCRALSAAGYTPVTYDNLVRGHEDAVRWGPLERGDVRDGARLDAVFARHRVEAVVHLAALAYVGESMREPGAYYLNNVAGTATLVEAMRRAGVDRLVFSSSCATYGEPTVERIPEDHPQEPVNPYGASKLMAERVLQDCGQAYGLRSVVLRYFNAAGADPSGDLGERHEPETHLIALALETAAGRRQYLEVLGRDHDTADGTCVRDYVHVSDLAAAHVAALQYLERDGESLACNLGGGEGASVAQVVALAAEATQRPIPLRDAPRRQGDPPRLVAEPGRAEAALGWAPRRSDLRTILEDAWAWHGKGRGPTT